MPGLADEGFILTSFNFHYFLRSCTQTLSHSVHSTLLSGLPQIPTWPSTPAINGHDLSFPMSVKPAGSNGQCCTFLKWNARSILVLSVAEERGELDMAAF